MPCTRRVVLASGLVAAAEPALAQAVARRPRVAYVWMFSEGPSAPYTEAFRGQMTRLGWVDGGNVEIDFRSADGSAEKLDRIMHELVRSRVDVIVAVCTPEANSARKFTQQIPIVMAATGDPVHAGLVLSLARPGTNVTGVSTMSLPLSAKRVALLKEAVPGLSRAVVLWNPVRRDNEPEVKIMQDASARLGMQLRSAQVRSREELADELESLAAERTQAVLNCGDNLVNTERKAIVARATALRLPSMFEDRLFVEDGGLMSYGPDLRAQHRRAADYVDRLLKGASAAELPIEQPTRFELVVNRRTARQLGLTLPRTLMLQADQVIG